MRATGVDFLARESGGQDGAWLLGSLGPWSFSLNQSLPGVLAAVLGTSGASRAKGQMGPISA